MQVSSSSSPPAKRTRAKSSEAAAAVTVTVKKSRKKTAAEPSATAQVEMTALQSAPVDVTAMIATAAYFIAAERNFSPGHELDDWLAAEQQVRSQLTG